MLPFKKILCPTDFSEPSYEALRAAGELASQFESELCIVHVVPPVPIIPMSAEPTAFNVSMYEQELETSSKKSLEEVVSQLESKYLKVRLIAVRGNAAEEIVRVADEEEVDLIVIATLGRTGLDRMIFGSVAEKVLRLASRPVLILTSRPTRVDKPGQVFGWSAMVAPYAYTGTARCAKDTRVIKISRDLIEEVIKEHPAEGLAVLTNLIAIIAGRLQFAYNQLMPES